MRTAEITRLGAERLPLAGNLSGQRFAAVPDQIVTMAVGGSGHINATNLDPTADYAVRAAIATARACWPIPRASMVRDTGFEPVTPTVSR